MGPTQKNLAWPTLKKTPKKTPESPIKPTHLKHLFFSKLIIVMLCSMKKIFLL